MAYTVHKNKCKLDQFSYVFMLRRLLENFLHQKYSTKSVIYEVIKKNMIYAYNLHKLS